MKNEHIFKGDYSNEKVYHDGVIINRRYYRSRAAGVLKHDYCGSSSDVRIRKEIPLVGVFFFFIIITLAFIFTFAKFTHGIMRETVSSNGRAVHRIKKPD